MANDASPPDDLVNFDDVLEGRVANGVHALTDETPVADLASLAASAGWRLLHVDCAGISTKNDCLVAWKLAAAFPEWVGNNWDALADALADLSWLHASGYAVLIENGERFTQASPADAATSNEILREVAAEWADNGTPFVVLTRSGIEAVD